MVRPEEIPQSLVKPQGTSQPVMRLQGTPQLILIPHKNPECEEPEPFQIDDLYHEDGTPTYKIASAYILSLMQKEIP